MERMHQQQRKSLMTVMPQVVTVLVRGTVTEKLGTQFFVHKATLE